MWFDMYVFHDAYVSLSLIDSIYYYSHITRIVSREYGDRKHLFIKLQLITHWNYQKFSVNCDSSSFFEWVTTLIQKIFFHV